MTGSSPRTLLLLGASNVSVSLRRILRLLRGGFDGELNVLVAAGHGRSYANRTRVLGRGLPGILRCGVWDALPPPPAPLHVLLTDVGNDLLYGTAPAVLTGWAATCLGRAGGRAETVVTLPPLARAEALAAWHYHAARAALFPARRPVPWPEMLDRVRELHGRLAELAAGRGCRVLDPPADWYGPDPIHVRRGRRTEAWSRTFALWPGFAPAGPARLPPVPPVWGRAADCTLLGRPRRTAQPVWEGGGMRLSLF